MESEDFFELEQRLPYEFKDKNLLIEALSHSSFVNEQSETDLRDNERLEFLGDAVLNLVVGHILMQRYPYLKEGDLSRMRAGLVNESQLAKVACSINLGFHIRLGKGEIQSNGREKNSILANTFEAVIAAIYLDDGFESAFKIITSHFSSLINSIKPPMIYSDYKSQLQEIVQVTHHVVPLYHVIEETGPDHDKTFRVEVKIGEIRKEGVGKSKKVAEQNAAQKALQVIKTKINSTPEKHDQRNETTESGIP
jgi:ribonuclease III